MVRLVALLNAAGLLAFLTAVQPAAAQDPTVPPDGQQPTTARVPLLSDAQAWQRLPEVRQGRSGPLPVWARALAGSLPRTTAAMLELDWLHRAAGPLDPVLRGKMRWIVARANRCDYSEAYAAADLVRAGLDDNDIRALSDDGSPSSEAERAVLRFARKLTVAASTITDEEVARLVELYGDKQVVAMVLLVGYGNFQDRLLLALGFEREEGGPLPPLAVEFSKQPSAGRAVAPWRRPPLGQTDAGVAARISDPQWLAMDFADLQERLESQRNRRSRIRVPSWEEVRALVAPGSSGGPPVRIGWSLVCAGYQPELAKGWAVCSRAFAQESKQDRVFEESVFWVTTRSIDCFY
ncbi:MAG: carboxymuconolactone decarboxylase family protein [Pirellulales bacterium]